MKKDKRLSTIEDEFKIHGLDAYHHCALLMPHFHRHNEIELNYVEEGGLTYLHGGHVRKLPLRQLALFWAAKPHQVISTDAPKLVVVHVPLAWFLKWELPESFTRSVLQGDLMVEHDLSESKRDHDLFLRWFDDLADHSPDSRRIVLLEIEARLRRFVRSGGPEWNRMAARQHKPGVDGEEELTKVEEMASFIAEHYTQPLTVTQIAEIAGLHPNYATTLFHKKIGISLVKYLNGHRISHAQLLLITTDAPVVDVAMQSGFGSVSRFYRAFKEASAVSPSGYRVSMLSLRRR